MRKSFITAVIGCLAFMALAGLVHSATWDIVKQVPLFPGTPQPLGMMHRHTSGPPLYGRIMFSNGLDSRVHIVDIDNPSTIIPPLYVHDGALDCSVTPLPNNCPVLGGLTNDDGYNFLAVAKYGNGSKWILVVEPLAGLVMGAIPYPTGVTELITGLGLDDSTGRADYSRGLPKLEAFDRFFWTPLADLFPSHGESIIGVETVRYDTCYATRVSDSQSIFPPAIVQMKYNGQEVGRKLVLPHDSDVAASLDFAFNPAKLYIWYTVGSYIYGVEGVTECNPTSIYSYSLADCEWASPNTVVRFEWLTINEAGVTSFDILRAPASTGPWTVVAPGIPATGPYVSPYLWTDLAPTDPGGEWYKARANTLAETLPQKPEGRCRF